MDSPPRGSQPLFLVQGRNRGTACFIYGIDRPDLLEGLARRFLGCLLLAGAMPLAIDLVSDTDLDRKQFGVIGAGLGHRGVTRCPVHSCLGQLLQVTLGVLFEAVLQGARDLGQDQGLEQVPDTVEALVQVEGADYGFEGSAHISRTVPAAGTW